MKLKPSAILAVIMVVLGWQADAQTNGALIVCTNFVIAAQNFREVNGQLYNTELSVLWCQINGKCLDVLTNGILIQTYSNEPIFKTVTISRESPDLVSGDDRVVTSPEQIWAGSKEVPAVKLIVRDFPADLNTADCPEIKFRAIRVGTADFKGNTLGLWDYGTPHFVKVVTTNYPPKLKADKVLESNQDAADKGDSYGLLRMGERYRDGDGVTKDLTRARIYLIRAADAGSPTAADELGALQAN